jgi:hypothetical protein
MIRGLESRISRLEQYRKPRCCYVINCDDPPTADELSNFTVAMLVSLFWVPMHTS